jgi:hypothetical protein
VRRPSLVIVLSAAVACIDNSTGIAHPVSGTYVLKSIDQGSLPVRLDDDGIVSEVVAGSLSLAPNGYFVFSETDTVRTVRAVARNVWTDGGTWSVDGSLLILSDTSADAIDPYGPETSTYLGSIGTNAVRLNLVRENGGTSHGYIFERH